MSKRRIVTKKSIKRTLKFRTSLIPIICFLLSFIFVLQISMLSAADMKPGPKVKTAEELQIHTGVNSASMIADKQSREAFILWARKVKQYFGNTVDGVSPDEHVTLCEATADYLYSKFTPLKVNYKQGSRPFLEKVVADVTQGIDSERAKIMALMRFVRNLQPNADRKDLFVGGTEEDLIRKRVCVCNEKARVLIILWQVAGFPSRYVGHHIGGHAGTEVYFEGKWAYIDVRGKYFLMKDGTFANTWEIWNNPSLITSQKPEVYLDMAPGYTIDSTRDMYFHHREVIGINNYFVSESDHYDYSWQIDPDWATKSGFLPIQEDYAKVRAEIFGLDLN